MDDKKLAAYVAGAFDWGSAFQLRVRKTDQYTIGYTVEPKIQFRKKNEAVMGLLNQFCTQHTVRHSVDQDNSGVWKLTITARDSVWRFLEAVYEYVVVRHNAVEIVLNEVRPRMEHGEHKHRDGFVELMQFVDDAREHTGRDKAKYDHQYFSELWYNGALPSDKEQKD